MNSKIRISAIVVLAGLVAVSAILTGCSKFLDKQPYASLTPAQAFTSASDLQLYTNSFYVSQLPNANTIFTGDNTSDYISGNNIPVLLTNQTNAIVIPNAALQTGQNGTYVYVINQDMTAQAQTVKVGWTVGDTSVITSGLQAGQRIVTDGQLRIIPGGKVEIKNGS